MEDVNELLKKEVGDFVDLHSWDSSCNASALYTGFHMVNIAMDKIKKLESDNLQWERCYKQRDEQLTLMFEKYKKLKLENNNSRCCGNCGYTCELGKKYSSPVKCVAGDQWK